LHMVLAIGDIQFVADSKRLACTSALVP
jgi:hypothetical protein